MVLKRNQTKKPHVFWFTLFRFNIPHGKQQYVHSFGRCIVSWSASMTCHLVSWKNLKKKIKARLIFIRKDPTCHTIISSQLQKEKLTFSLFPISVLIIQTSSYLLANLMVLKQKKHHLLLPLIYCFNLLWCDSKQNPLFSNLAKEEYNI